MTKKKEKKVSAFKQLMIDRAKNRKDLERRENLAEENEENNVVQKGEVVVEGKEAGELIGENRRTCQMIDELGFECRQKESKGLEDRAASQSFDCEEEKTVFDQSQKVQDLGVNIDKVFEDLVDLVSNVVKKRLGHDEILKVLVNHAGNVRETIEFFQNN